MTRHVRSALITGAFFVLFFCKPATASAQDRDKLDSLYAELDLLFAEDSLSENLFSEADSLLLLMESRFSSLSVRSSFTSEVLTSGRDLGYSQYGLITGASYYHRSGFYGDANGYVNSEYSPQYYLTDLGIGYIGQLGERILFQAGHNFQFFDSSVDWIFNKNAHFSTYYQRNRWETGIDYRYLYGRESAHRLIATGAYRLSWETKGWIDRIRLIPSLSIQFGNANVVYFRQTETPVADLNGIILEDPDYPDLDRQSLLTLAFLLHRERYLRAVQLLKESGYSNEQIENLFLDFQDSQYAVENSFGLMNIALGLGISLTRDQWNLYLNYSYNFPQALPGENYTYEPNDYFSLSLFYTVIWPSLE